MWVKNLNLYRLAGSFELSAEALHQQLEQKAFRPCGSMDMANLGWVAPLGHLGEQLTHQSNGCIMVCLRREEKVLPAAVVREIVNDKVLEIETEQMRRVARKEKESIRDEVLQELLPRAFTRSKLTYAYIDPRQGWILVDNPTASKAEELISLLRETLGSFPVRPLAAQHSPAAMMTAWVDGSARADGLNEFMFGSGPSRRFIGEMTPDGVVGYNVIPGGQSGLFYHPNYSSQLPLWLTNSYHPLAVTEEDADDVAILEYTFGPAMPAAAAEEENNND